MSSHQSQTLGLPHLDDVIAVLKKCGFNDTRWFRLGLKLGLLKTTLDAIKKDNTAAVDDCLMECLAKWLSRADNVVSKAGGPPTLKSLSAALRAIDENAVADEIDTEKHRVPSYTHQEDQMEDGGLPSKSDSEDEKLPPTSVHEHQLQKHMQNTCDSSPSEVMFKFDLYCNHPVLNEIMTSRYELKPKEFTVSENTPLHNALKQAHEHMELKSQIPLDCCRLVKYDFKNKIKDQSFDIDADEFKGKTLGELLAGHRKHRPFQLLLETRSKEDRPFEKYNNGGLSLAISVIDQETDVHDLPQMRAETGWTVSKLKETIGTMTPFTNHTGMNLVWVKDKNSSSTKELSNDAATLEEEGFSREHKIKVFASELTDYQEIRSIIDVHINRVVLNIMIPSKSHGRPDVVPYIPSSHYMKDEIKVKVDRRTTLAELKKNLASDVGVEPIGFRVYRVFDDKQEHEMKQLNDSFISFETSAIKLKIIFGRALQPGEHRIKIYLLNVNEPAEFSHFMMESIVAKNTTVYEFKKQIIDEA